MLLGPAFDGVFTDDEMISKIKALGGKVKEM
jgi:hypothetical protein